MQICVLRYCSTVQTNFQKIAFLDRFFAQLDTKILEKQKHPLFKMFAGTNSRGNTNKSLNHAMPESEQLHNYPSSNPTLTWLVISGLLVVRGGVGGWLLRCWDWPKISLAFPLELVPADILNNNCFSCLNMHFLLSTPSPSLSLSFFLFIVKCPCSLNQLILSFLEVINFFLYIHILSSKQITIVLKFMW